MDQNPVGEGGSAIVFRVLDLELNVVRALKILLVDVGADSDADQRWQREQQLLIDLEKIDVPGVPTVYDVGCVDGMPAIVMQFIDGDTLGQYLLRLGDELRSLSPKTADRLMRFAVDVVYKTATTLAYIQDEFTGQDSNQFAHGDIKPSNILLEGSSNNRENLDVSRVWLLDFGEASLVTPESSRGITPAYSSPEQLLGWIQQESPEATPLSDQYQLGVVFQELLAPLADAGKGGLSQWAFATRLKKLKSIAARMTARNPSDRFSTFEAVQSELLKAMRLPQRRMIQMVGLSVCVLFAFLTLFSGKNSSEGVVNQKRPVNEDVAATVIDNQWERFQNSPLSEASLDELKQQIAVGYDVWQSAHGNATADLIREQLSQRLELLDAGSFALRVISATPEFSEESTKTFDEVAISIEVEGQEVGRLVGQRNGGEVEFLQNDLEFDWKPGENIDLFVSLDSPQARDDKKKQDARNKDYELKSRNSTFRIPPPAPPSFEPYFNMRGGRTCSGAMGLVVQTLCTECDGTRFLGTTHGISNRKPSVQGNIKLALEIRASGAE